MAWIDIAVGAFVGLILALILSRQFVTRPKITIVIVIIFVLLGLTLSDNFLTPNDKRWNIIDKIKTFFQTRFENNKNLKQ